VTYFQPALPLLLVLGLAAVFRSYRSSTDGRRRWLELISLAGIWIISIQAAAWVLSRPIEMRYPEQAVPQSPADAIVVLAGAVHAPRSGRPYSLPGPDTYRRVRHAAWLFHHWKQLPILVCGGGNQATPLAEVMRDLLTGEGVPPDMIWLESRSTNTHESAVYGSEVLRAKAASRVVLVVEANSMLRAALSFEKAGVHVVPAVVSHTRAPTELTDFLPRWSAIAANEEIIHEVVGLAWYKIRGWI
jgi:uncharacterized SAM-binding protein YcdF (DUF218 family)